MHVFTYSKSFVKISFRWPYTGIEVELVYRAKYVMAGNGLTSDQIEH